MARVMKDSGIEWIGEIPENWTLAKGKSLYEITTGKLDANAENPSGEYPFFTCSMLPKRIDTYAFDCEALLVAGNGIVGFTQYYNGKFNAYQRTYVLSNFRQVMPSYLKYYVSNNLSTEVAPNSVGSVIQFIKLGDLQNFHIVFPSSIEQKCIVDFLDRKCAEIDAVIEKTKATIEEYKKLKQSVITEAVTKGIRGNRPMKDSGIDWIGESPVDWQITKVKWLLTERKDRSESGEEEPLSMSQKYGLIPTKEMDMIPNMASTFVGAKLVKTGDLVFNKLKAHLGVFAVSKYEGLVSPDYAVYFSTGLAHAKFLEYLFKTPQYIAEFRKKSSGVGAGLTRLYTDDLFSIACSLPCFDEQVEIVAHLNDMCMEMDTLIAKKTALLTELETYKKSLIYEYVTGKKECVIG